MRARPYFTLLPPLLTFLVLCALSVAGVTLGANQYERETRARAASAALDWAASFRLSAERVFTPLVTLGILIEQRPNFKDVAAAFPATAAALLKDVNADGAEVLQELQVSPLGIIMLIYPKNAATDSRLGLNIFKEPALRGGALNTIRARRIVVNGPLKLVQGNFGFIARTPIFIKNASATESWGLARSAPDNCGALCYDAATREKFWGFATAIGPLDALRAGNDSRLAPLRQKGYKWL